MAEKQVHHRLLRFVPFLSLYKLLCLFTMLHAKGCLCLPHGC